MSMYLNPDSAWRLVKAIQEERLAEAEKSRQARKLRFHDGWWSSHKTWGKQAASPDIQAALPDIQAASPDVNVTRRAS
jgi:hypothetical protein